MHHVTTRSLSLSLCSTRAFPKFALLVLGIPLAASAFLRGPSLSGKAKHLNRAGFGHPESLVTFSRPECESG